jgi:hypothetical protein
MVCQNDTEGVRMAESKKPRQQVNAVAVGRISKEPETRGKVQSTSLAVNQRVRENGEWVDGPTMWFDLATAGPQLLGVSKGDLVEVKGRLSMRVYKEKVYYTIWADEVANLTVDSDFPVGA